MILTKLRMTVVRHYGLPEPKPLKDHYYFEESKKDQLGLLKPVLHSVHEIINPNLKAHFMC